MQIIYVHPNDPEHCQVLNIGKGCFIEFRQYYRGKLLVNQQLLVNGFEFASNVLTPFYFDGQARPVWWQPPYFPQVDCEHVHFQIAQNHNTDLSQETRFDLARLMPVLNLSMPPFLATVDNNALSDHNAAHALRPHRRFAGQA